MKLVYSLILTFVVNISTFTQISNAAQSRSIVLRNVTVIDATGSPPLPNMTVVISGNRIVALGRTERVRVPRNAQVINGTGKFLIPGLWDMHIHLSLATELVIPALIANGVTGVRDMGGSIDQIDEWRRRIAGGDLLGPRIVRAGSVVDGQKPDAPFRLTVTSTTEARQAVISLKRRRADFIKVHNAVPREAYFTLANEARRQNVSFVGHIPKEITPAEASDAGQRSIEHTESLFENIISSASQRGQSARDALNQAFAAYHDDRAATLFRRFRRNGTWYDPVLVTYRSFAFRKDFAANPDPRNRYVAASTRRSWDQYQPIPQNLPAETISLRKSVFQRFLELVGLMRREQVNILAGTDAGGIRDVIPGFSLHDELALLVQAGLTPMEALQTATRNPATFLGMSASLGTVERGKFADLVLLEANPLENIKNTQIIDAVIVNGRYVPKSELQSMLAHVETTAGQR
ncbi:MAG TPA: amidohydrolase family protein [Pyrinomonadaceae bacterium]|nr:amidohydrolase family protein [Pyrinomonadaceae bacterium]